MHEPAEGKQVTPIWIIDEAQNLAAEFFRDFPAFLNFAFDSRDLLAVWMVGTRRWRAHAGAHRLRGAGQSHTGRRAWP